ncbi:chaperon dnaj [Acanthamoeba polyphaga mimivirus]|uniref:Chaperon dnaj n=2 Tax=Megamimivirinae TaxID=3044648 RepID=A0A2L2DI54_MIMIV|nr:hypothetical protein MegaChil _gp0101 [Megavirus chiliensis]AEQ33217.1 cysteine-rich domain of DnaJ protein [Megavirus chiliensis]AVG45839.1 chaperon dnaj [Acanthamoeba polyphaga mimivirus]AVG46942.1 chaperon dnaj [Acanthamoeba polyphaga mimivirus]
MPKFVKCYACNGTGTQYEMGEEMCPGCAGTGRDKTSDLWLESCSRCGGSGRVSYSRRGRSCMQCRGTGGTIY